jgi:formylglycine-generating enzyme required for sulfatase activity
VRAGTTTAYPWGDDIGRNNANCNGCGSQWDNKQQTAPVGSFASNAFGL